MQMTVFLRWLRGNSHPLAAAGDGLLAGLKGVENGSADNGRGRRLLLLYVGDERRVSEGRKLLLLLSRSSRNLLRPCQERLTLFFPSLRNVQLLLIKYDFRLT